MSDNDFRAIVVGQESLDNLRLANTLRKFLGKEQVFRYLETRHLLEFLADKDRQAIGIFFDLFSFPVEESTQTIGYIRDRYPDAVFCIYLSNLEHQTLWHTLPDKWQQRIGHYMKLYKEPDDAELEPLVNLMLNRVMGEALVNLDQGALKMSNWKEKFDKPYQTDDTPHITDNMIFISYSRRDWDVFVSPLADRLRDKGFSVWIDKHLLAGGDDWMDSIGEALDKCKLLILVITPESLESRFVKMEYRFFFNQGRPIVPLLYRTVERIPPELSLIQHIDFTGGKTPFTELMQVITANLQGEGD